MAWSNSEWLFDIWVYSACFVANDKLICQKNSYVNRLGETSSRNEESVDLGELGDGYGIFDGSKLFDPAACRHAHGPRSRTVLCSLKLGLQPFAHLGINCWYIMVYLDTIAVGYNNCNCYCWYIPDQAALLLFLLIGNQRKNQPELHSLSIQCSGRAGFWLLLLVLFWGGQYQDWKSIVAWQSAVVCWML